MSEANDTIVDPWEPMPMSTMYLIIGLGVGIPFLIGLITTIIRYRRIARLRRDIEAGRVGIVTVSRTVAVVDNRPTLVTNVTRMFVATEEEETNSSPARPPGAPPPYESSPSEQPPIYDVNPEGVRVQPPPAPNRI